MVKRLYRKCIDPSCPVLTGKTKYSRMHLRIEKFSKGVHKNCLYKEICDCDICDKKHDR